MSRASAVLQKAFCQLRGERVPIRSREEDELSNYLNNLSQKTGKQSRSFNFEDYGDHISISSDSNVNTYKQDEERAKISSAASRFMKKSAKSNQEQKSAKSNQEQKSAKSNQEGVQLSTPQYAASSTTPKYAAPANQAGKSTVGKSVVQAPGKVPGKAYPRSDTTQRAQSTQVLDKAKALSSKIKERNAAATKKKGNFMETDTEDSVSLANFMFDGGSVSSVGTEGAGGTVYRNRFLKQNKGSVEKTAELKRPNTPSRGQRRPERVPDYAQKGKVRYAGSVQLTSEEESMADFIQRLSSKDDAKKAQQKSKGRSLQSPDIWKKRPSSPLSRPTRSPSPVHGRRYSRSPSQDSDNVESIQSEVADTDSSNNIFNTINIMDLADLDALEPEPVEVKVLDKKKSPKIKKSKNKKKTSESERLSKPRKTDSIFGNFGLHSVDELMRDVSEIIEVESEASEIITEKSDVFAAKGRKDSVASSITEIGQESGIEQVYSEDFEESIMEQIGVVSSSTNLKQVHWSVQSEIRSEYSDITPVEYTADFNTTSALLSTDSELSSESETYLSTDSESSRSRSVAQHVSTDSNMVAQRTDSKRADTKLIGTSDTKLTPTTRSVEIQTEADTGLSSPWNMGFMDPTSIMSHVVSADTVEAMTAHNPSMAALHDLLKQQLFLTRTFIDTQRRIYESSTVHLRSDYKYTTLQDTKEFIRKHRRPKTTFKEALKMVTREMNNGL